MKNRYLLQLALWLAGMGSFLHCQAQLFTVSGYVTDAASGEQMIGATIIDKRSFAGTVTNEYGFFSLTIPGGEATLQASYIGYAHQLQTFSLVRDTTFHFKLQSSTELEEIVVEAEKSGEQIQERTQMSTMEIPIEQIKSLPAFLGEVDVLKTLQLLPGVSGGSEGTSGLFVRGGSPDQNLILLDGVPVYNASHLFGFFSVFNSDAINKVTLIKGGFPARYGGRLSSVVDIRMKEGNMQSYHGEGSIGLIASRLTLEGPIVKDKTAFIVSGRRTYIDLITRPILQSQNEGNSTQGYYFYDLNAKVNHKFSDKDRLYVSGYFGRDRAYFNNDYQYDEDTYRTEESGIAWGNATAVARWNHMFNQKTFSNLTATFTDYTFSIFSNFKDEQETLPDTYFGFQYYSGISDWTLKYDFDYIPSPKHYIKYGAGITYHTFRPGASEFESDDPDFELPPVSVGAANIYATEVDLYAENDHEVTDLLKVNYGMHLSGFFVGESFYYGIQPRVSARYLLSPDLSLKASFSTMTQYIHLLTNSGIGLPTDLWVPATDSVPPQRAWQPAIGIAYSFKKEYEVSVEGYYKKMNDIIEYLDGANYLVDGLEGWEEKVESGEGWAYGAEFFVQKKYGQLSGWVGYTLSWSNRRFPNINLGETFPFKYDRRHDFEIACIYKLNDHIEFSGTWVYTSGQPITLPVAKYEGQFGEPLYAYEGRNGYRMMAYHRLDLNVAFHKEKKHWSRTWNIGAYNAYSRLNPYFIYLEYDYQTNTNQYVQVSLFPIIPNISYEFKF